MIFTLVFILIAVTWGFQALYYLRRFLKRGWVQSVVFSFAALAFPAWSGAQLGYLGRLPLSLFLAVALSIGVLGVWSIIHAETQRLRPFSKG